MLSTRILILALTWLAIGVRPLPSQQAPSLPSPLPAYRPPVLALVQPAAGGSLPSDKPALVFRFAPGDANDPIDAQSFAVTVDGVDHTSRFHVTAAEAWGMLEDADGGDAADVGTGVRQVFARVCSTRGACAEVSTTVPVVEAARANSASSNGSSSARRRRVVDAVVAAILRLLEQ